MILRVSPPRIANQLLVDDLDDLLTRTQVARELDAHAPLPHCAVNFRTTPISTSASKKAVRIAKDLVDVGVGQASAPAHASG